MEVEDEVRFLGCVDGVLSFAGGNLGTFLGGRICTMLEREYGRVYG